MTIERDEIKVVIGVDIDPKKINRLRERFPRLVFQSAIDSDRLSDAVTDAEILFAKNVPPIAWERARRLRWFQAGTAGVDQVLPHVIERPDLVITTASGAHGEVISELIVAMMLSFATGLHELERYFGRTISTCEREAIATRKFILRGQTAGIIGLGDIGASVAPKLRALGLRTIGVSRSGARARVVDVHYHPPELRRALRNLDHLVLCVPHTPETQHIIGTEEIYSLKRGAFIYNVGRGGAIDTEALVAALCGGRLAGAGLDVTDPEPLPIRLRCGRCHRSSLPSIRAGAFPIIWN